MRFLSGCSDQNKTRLEHAKNVKKISMEKHKYKKYMKIFCSV